MSLVSRTQVDARRKAGTSAAVTRADGVAAQHVQVTQPKSVTLVDVPANARAFSIIRSAPAEDGTEAAAPMRRRLRRSDETGSKNLLSLAFPPGYTAEDIERAMKSFGLGTDYETVVTDGHYEVRRSDLQALAKDAQTMDIKLTDDGIRATVLRAENSQPATSGKTGLSLHALEIDVTRHDAEKISAFLTENGVDFSDAALENLPETGTAVLERAALPENTEVKRIEVEDGIVAVVTRSDAMDLPAGFAQAVCEAAYGSWGWGQLDFAAAMADIAVCEMLERGVRRFESVVNRILFYSELPLDSRKLLVTRATGQFQDFINGLLDSLPRQVLLAVGTTQRSAVAAATQENDMADKNAAPAANTPAAAGAADQGNAQYVTRADFDTFKGELKDLIRGTQPAAAAAPAADTGAAASQTEEKALTRSDLAAAVGEAMKPFAEQLTKLGETTVVRNAADPAQKPAETEEEPEPANAGEKADRLMRGSIFRR